MGMLGTYSIYNGKIKSSPWTLWYSKWFCARKVGQQTDKKSSDSEFNLSSTFDQLLSDLPENGHLQTGSEVPTVPVMWLNLCAQQHGHIHSYLQGLVVIWLRFTIVLQKAGISSFKQRVHLMNAVFALKIAVLI